MLNGKKDKQKRGKYRQTDRPNTHMKNSKDYTANNAKAIGNAWKLEKHQVFHEFPNPCT